MPDILNLPAIQVIKTILDILVVTYLIYFLYSLFHETNSITILKGFVFLIVINIVANLFEFTTLAWILQYVVNYFVILVVVLFQPEIRRILSQVGRRGLASIRGKISRETMEELTRGAFYLGENRTGALIILERSVGLKDLLDDSVQLDAMLKSELLASIFFKNSLLHDGAIIVQDQKIIAARVIIPSVMIDAATIHKRGLGTRHRAGVAVTVDSDAIAIIVSEETGGVSIAYNGELDYHLSQERFVRRLNEIFGN